jgi:hypothetical protein
MQYGLFFCALRASEIWNSVYMEWIDSPFGFKRREAIGAKARAIVLFDRVLNGEIKNGNKKTIAVMTMPQAMA